MKWLLAFFVASALAADAPPKFTVDMTTVLKDWDGKPIKDTFQATPEDPICKQCDDLTLGEAVVHSLVVLLQADKDVAGDQRWAWQEIARRIRRDPEAQLTAKEQSVIADRIFKVYAQMPLGSVVIGAAMPLIDPNRKPELK